MKDDHSLRKGRLLIAAVMGLTALRVHAAPTPPPGPPPAPILVEIEISGQGSLLENTTEQYTCTAVYSDGSTDSVSPLWSTDASEAVIDSSGVLSAGEVSEDSTVNVIATHLGETASLAVSVIDIPLTGLSISGPATLSEGQAGDYTCTATYADGRSEEVNPSWSEDSAYADINTQGILTGGDVPSDQNITITALFDGQTATYDIVLQDVAPILTGINITGPSSLNEGSAEEYVCTASYSDGSSLEVVPEWSEDSAFATIDAGGVLAAGDVSSDQSLQITASFDGLTDTHGVTIQQVISMTGIEISGPASLTENTNVQYVCTVRYEDGSSSQVTPTWSTDTAFAIFSSDGVLSVPNVDDSQQITLSASYNGLQDSLTVSVEDIGSRTEIPLVGYEGQTVYTVLWDSVGGTNVIEEFVYEPDVFIIENVEADRWYWFGIGEYDTGSGTTNKVHGQWIWM